MDHFDEKEAEILEKIAKLYDYEKGLMIYAEELADESFIPAINEIKDAFDHLMRVFSVKFGLRERDSKYVNDNLDATFRHLYRATFDLLDFIRLLQKERIYELVKDFSRETLVKVFPEYYNTIVPEIEGAMQKIPRYKSEKDIGNPNLESVKGYVEIIEGTKLHFTKISEMMPSLVDYEDRKKKEENKNELKQFAIYAIIALLAAVVGAFITYMLTVPHS
jgi:phosphoenolpyruvate synthase/pyruvate phosphate dikinase